MRRRMKSAFLIELPRKHTELHGKVKITGIPCVSVAIITGIHYRTGHVLNHAVLNNTDGQKEAPVEIRVGARFTETVKICLAGAGILT